MSSSLLTAFAYLSLLSILVVGIVMAIKRRHLVGARASKQLAAGAALLLLGQAFIPLRPLLRDMIATNAFAQFGSVADLLVGFTMLQVLLHAAGIGLIIAAALGRRPHSAPAELSLPGNDSDQSG